MQKLTRLLFTPNELLQVALLASAQAMRTLGDDVFLFPVSFIEGYGAGTLQPSRGSQRLCPFTHVRNGVNPVFEATAHPGQAFGADPEGCPACALGACIRRVLITPAGIDVHHDQQHTLN